MELLKPKLLSARFVFIATVFILAGCTTNPYPNFSNVGDKLYVQLHQFGEEKNLTLCEAYESQISIKLRLKRENKNSFDYWNDYSYQHITAEGLGNELLGEALCRTKQSDSLSLIFPYSYIKESLLDDYYTDNIIVPDTTMMQMEILVLKLDSKIDIREELKNEYTDGILLEDVYLKKYIINEGLEDECMLKHGVFIQKTKTTKGDSAKYGLDLGINYQGYFLDGKQFDNTYIDSTTLYFQLGKPDQVIQGLSIALGYMQEGEEARIYIPSYLGFGARGSTDGRVPPNTPIYFDLIVSDVYTVDEIKEMAVQQND